jgi:hypothetical protein
MKCSSFYRFLLRPLACLLLIAFFPTLLIAQDLKRDTEVVQLEELAVKETAKTAKESARKKFLEKVEKVTFEQILSQPDNIELNFQYAQQQVRENDLLGAASTLERILLINPNLAQVRLFYAVVLYRLDNLSEAERELNTLSALPMPDSLRQELKLYKRQIRLRKKRTRFNLRESLGYQFDSNRNASPSSKHRLFAEIPLDVSGKDTRRPDASFLNITSIDVTHDLGFQAGHDVFASFTYFLQNQTAVDNLDLTSFQYEFGGTYRNRFFNFRPSFYASHIFLDWETFLRIQGGRFEIFRNFFNRLDVSIESRIERQDYSGIKQDPAAGQRSGNEFDLGGSANFLLTPSMKVFGGIGYARKNAKEDYNAYDRLSLKAGHTWLLGRGQFLINTMDVDFDRYDEPDIAIANRIRHDASLRYRVTYGAPLTFFLIGKILPYHFKDITLSFTYEYFRSLSNIRNYTYTNNKVQGLFTKSLEF